MQGVVPLAAHAESSHKSEVVQQGKPYPGHLIKQGDKGVDVKRIQARLNEANIDVSIDGVFGSKTKMAVEKFQKKFGLQVDGVVGPETWDILFNYAENI